MYYFIVFAAVVLLALQFSTNKAYQLRCGTSVLASLRFTALSGFASSVVPLIVALAGGEGIKITPYSALMAALIAIFCGAYTFIGFRVMSLGSLSVYTMFLMLGGMLLPYIFGVLWLDEGISVCRIAGVLLLAVSLIFPVIAREKNGRAGVLFFVLCGAVFILNGGVSIVSKLHQVNCTYASVGAASFSMWANLFNGIISSLMYVLFKIRLTDSDKAESAVDGTISKTGSVKNGAGCKNEAGLISGAGCKSGAGPIAVIIAANAVCNGVSYMLQLVSAGHVPASVMYPMMTGGSMVLTAAAGYIFFREKPDKLSGFGIILSFAATFLFLF